MKKVKLLICLVMIFIPQQIVQGQYLLKLSAEDCVSLSLDMIKKGVQRQNVDAIMRVVGPSVLVQGTEPRSSDKVAETLTDVFANSSDRDRVKGEKALPRTGPGMDSDLWDFDILSPEITVKGDSAFVECELVLWEAHPTGTSKVGSKSVERLVFWSPFENQPSNSQSKAPYRWKLVGCDNLFDFLTSFGEKFEEKADGKGGTK